MKTSQEGIDLIKHFEGFSPVAYRCPAGVWTLGYGSTMNVTPLDTITKEDAEDLLEMELARYEAAVESLITQDLKQHQFDALVSFCYNLGEGNLSKSTLRKKINTGKLDEASMEFGKWVNAAGKRLEGLVKRRQAEADMFNGLPWRKA